MKTLSWLVLLGVVGVLLTTAGCALFLVGAAAGAGAAGYAYVNGELKSTESASLEQTTRATLAAMKDLEYPVTSQAKDALSAELTARNASDKKIVVRLKKISDTTTEVRIRVGTFGDESLSRVVLEKIKKHL